jgi:hypothetical protein
MVIVNFQLPNSPKTKLSEINAKILIFVDISLTVLGGSTSQKSLVMITENWLVFIQINCKEKMFQNTSCVARLCSKKSLVKPKEPLKDEEISWTRVTF